MKPLTEPCGGRKRALDQLSKQQTFYNKAVKETEEKTLKRNLNHHLMAKQEDTKYYYATFTQKNVTVFLKQTITNKEGEIYKATIHSL